MRISTKVEEIRVTQDTLNSWNFDPADLKKEQRLSLSAWILTHSEGCAELVHNKVPESNMNAFVMRVEESYLDNPYHNLPTAWTCYTL